MNERLQTEIAKAMRRHPTRVYMSDDNPKGLVIDLWCDGDDAEANKVMSATRGIRAEIKKSQETAHV